jgi:hypothetical protein
MSVRYDPATLDQIDAVDIVALRALDIDRRPAAARLFGGLHEIQLEGSAADEIASLWRELPRGESMRCHVPPYRLRFRVKGTVVVEASLCWECNNAYGSLGTQPIHFAFDAEAPVSRRLLERLLAELPLESA